MYGSNPFPTRVQPFPETGRNPWLQWHRGFGLHRFQLCFALLCFALDGETSAPPFWRDSKILFSFLVWTTRNFHPPIISKIVTIVATSCQIFKTKMRQSDFGCGSVSDPSESTYSAPLYPLGGFNKTTSKEKGKRRDGTGGEGRRGKGVCSLYEILNMPLSDSLQCG